MKNLAAIILVFGFTYFYSNAQQSNWEIGGQIGLAGYQGDLVLTDAYESEELKFTYGFLVRYHITKHLNLRGNILRGRLSGNDNMYDERVGRGFSFSSSMTELSGTLEFDILGYKRHQNGRLRRIVSPYVFIGAGVSYVERNTNYNEADTNIPLEDITIDKQNTTRDTWVTIPFGLGVKMNVNESLMIGVDWATRPVFTDKLDGVEVTGNASKNDWYGVGTLNISYRFNKTTVAKPMPQ